MKPSSYQTNGLPGNPPPFAWDEWYSANGGRLIQYAEIDAYFERIHAHQYPRFQGVIAPERQQFASPADASLALKSHLLNSGATMVGVAEVTPAEVYRGRTAEGKYAVMIGLRMLWRAFQVVPSPEAAIECVRVYFELGELVVAAAELIRSWGYAAQVQPPVGDSHVLFVPLAIKAGFGELGRHGSIIHPQWGPLFRLGAVTTDFPLAIDAPIDAGIGAFCDKCRACRIYCPANAIPDQRSPEAGKDPQGNDRYMIDTGRCFPYFAKHDYCMNCLAVCVYNHKEWAKDFEGHPTALFPDVRMPESPPPLDSVDQQLRHTYPQWNRETSGL
jgi:ferredoxin